MKKLLASDLDGTLVLPHHEVMIEENEQALKKLQKAGHYFVVATGRGFTDSAFIKQRHNIHYDYMVLLNGALLIDKDDKVIERHIIPNQLLQEIYHQYTKPMWRTSFNTGFCYVHTDKKATILTAGDIFIDTIEALENHDISLVSIDCVDTPPEEMDETIKLINENYGDAVIAFRSTHYIDIIPKGHSKGNGILKVAELFDVSKENIYTIGDSWNDVSMFEITENSYTFPHVEKELRNHAKHTVHSVHECVEILLKNK